jgi:hypothetical protein
VTATLIAFAVFAAAAVFAWTTFSERVQEGAPSTPAPATSGSPTGVELSSLPEGWTELPAPPDIRSGAAQVWAGSQLLIWGGSSGWSDEQPPERVGMAFDASSNTFRNRSCQLACGAGPRPTPSSAILATSFVSGELLGEPSAELRANLADSPVRLFTPYLSM